VNDTVGSVPLRAGLFVGLGVALSTGLFALLSTYVVFGATAIPVLYRLSDSLGVGANGWLVASYAAGGLASYAFVYRGGLDWFLSRLGR
jgi:hypothetical protein